MQGSLIIYSEELSVKWIDKLADAKISTLGIHPRGGRWAVDSLKSLVEEMKTPEYRALIDYAHKRGLTVEYEMHAAGYLLPRELFSEHPEYFRINGEGERTNDYNFCVSNSEALEIYAHRAAELALCLYGSRHDFYFWMDDGYDLHCHCPKCRSLSPSDQQLLVMNRVIREIRKHIPDARAAYLAYVDTILPPRAIRPADGIFLEYAPFRKYTAKGENSASLIDEERRMLIPLTEYFSGQTRKVLEYWYDNSLFSNWTKPPCKFELDENAMRRDIREYREIGFDAISSFACFLGEEYEQLHGDNVDATPFGECLKR